MGYNVKWAYISARGRPRDVYGEWHRTSGIEESGCLLVRPDGYIAWRLPSSPEGGPAQAARDALRAALTVVLHR